MGLNFNGRRDTNPTLIINRVPKYPLIVSPRNFQISVNRFFTDIDGVIYAPGAEPAALRVSYPVYILGAFDRAGGYKIARQSIIPNAATPFLFSFVAGRDLPFPYATGLNEINVRLTPGDLVNVFTDSIDNPNYYIFIVQTVRAQVAGVGALLFDTINARHNTMLQSIDYSTYDAAGASYDLQFNEKLRFISFNDLGTFRTDDENPLAYKDPAQYLSGYIRVPYSALLNEKFGFATFLQYGCNSLTFNFNIQ